MNHDYFTTYDLNLSTALVASGFSLEKISKQGQSRGLFCFKKHPDLIPTIDRYYKDQLSISPRVLFDSLKAIKNRLYSNVEELD